MKFSNIDFFNKKSDTNALKTPPKEVQNFFWNTNTPKDRLVDKDNLTSILSKTKTLEEIEKDLLNKSIIKRPIRAEDLEAMLLNSDNNRKTLASMENSKLNVSENLNLVNKPTGWSPFSTEGFISNINSQKQSINGTTVHDENTKPQNIMKKLGLISSPSNNCVNLADSEDKVKKFITVDELEKSLLNTPKPQDQAKTAPHMMLSSNEKQLPNNFFNSVNLQGHNVHPVSTFSNLLTQNLQSSNLSQLNPLLLTNRYSASRLLYPSILTPSNVHQTTSAPTTASTPATGMTTASTSLIQQPRLPQYSQYQQKVPLQRRQMMTSNRNRGNSFNHDKGNKDDEYAGLMTQRDKEWIIKIQNLQLHFDDPYKEDYYFVTFNSRKLTAAAKETSDGKSTIPSLIIPERSKAGSENKSNERTYEPLRFEGSLGKIQVSNVNNPRKLLDIDGKLPSVDNSDRTVAPVGRAELNNFRKLLLDIENLYVVMLNIDEEDKKMGALPEETKATYLEKRNELCLQLFHGIYDEKNENINYKIVSIKKGRSLVFRSLIVLTNLVHKYKIIKCILQNNNLKNMASQGAHQEYGLNYGQILTEAIKSLNHQEDEETILPPILTT